MPRPKADLATIVGVLLAAAALIFSVYAYFNPYQAPTHDSVPAPAASATPSPHATGSVDEPSLGDQHDQEAIEEGDFLGESGAYLRGLADDLVTYRYDQPWWRLLVVWPVWMVAFAWLGNAQARPGRITALGGAGYIWYFFPSLSWWGVTVSAVAGAVTAIVVFLESYTYYSGDDAESYEGSEPTDESGQSTV